MTPRIALVPGSGGAGPAFDDVRELIDSLRDVVDFETIELGVGTYRQRGVPLPDDTLAALRDVDAIVMATPPNPGPGDTDIPAGLLEHGIVFGLRKALRLSINLRTFLGAGANAGIDIAVVRENSEGAYFSPGDVVHPDTNEEAAVQAVLTTRTAVERCVRYGFEEARRRRRSLVIAHKVRVLTGSGGLWTRAAERIAPEYPEVVWRVESIDTCCGRLIADPTAYDVIATDNVFGDILADVVSARSGAGDYAVSAEFALGEAGPSLFEPMHDTHSPAAEHRERRHLGLSAALGAALVHVGEAERGLAVQASVRAEVESLYELPGA